MVYNYPVSKIKFVAGIDEAGRGPLAGPVAVGVFVAPKNFDYKIFRGLRDSKKLSQRKREEIFSQIKILKKLRKANFAVVLVGEKYIDKNGISKAVKFGIDSGIKKLNLNLKNTFIYLDGLLQAPEKFSQETVIKGDDKIPTISAASVCAKVTRDAYMRKISKKFPKYGLQIHKGYGTERHIICIKKFGLSLVHRKSFCAKILQ